jgi:hypothetical protein
MHAAMHDAAKGMILDFTSHPPLILKLMRTKKYTENLDCQAFEDLQKVREFQPFMRFGRK